jgi:hypothetical protein
MNKAKPKEKCPVYSIFPFTPRLRALLEADILDKLFVYEEYREIISQIFMIARTGKHTRQ